MTKFKIEDIIPPTPATSGKIQGFVDFDWKRYTIGAGTHVPLGFPFDLQHSDAKIIEVFVAELSFRPTDSITLWWQWNDDVCLYNNPRAYRRSLTKGEQPAWAYWKDGCAGHVRFLVTGPNPLLELVAVAFDEPPPTQPIAHIADGVRTVPVGELLELDGSDSTDPEHHELSYAWTLVSRPPHSTATLGETTGSKPSLTPDLPGTYTVELVVTDTKDSESSTPVRVDYVAKIVNRPPVIESLPVGHVLTGDTIDVSAGLRASDPDDADAESLTYTWKLRGPADSKASLVGGGAEPTFTPDLPGEYTVELTVSDGKAEDSDQLTWVAEEPPDTPPVAVITGDGGTITTGERLALDGRKSSDADDDTLSYSWTLSERPPESNASIGGSKGAQASFTPDVDGDYTVELRVTAKGVESEPVELRYTAKTPNHQPSANAGGDGKGVVGVPIQLHGSGKDEDEDKGDKLDYAWTLIAPDGSKAILDAPKAKTPSFTPDLPGPYRVELVVTDSKAASSPVAKALWNVSPSTIPTATNVSIDFLAKGDAAQEYVEITNTSETTLLLDGLEIRIPTAPAQATRRSFTFGDTHETLDPGATLRVYVGPKPDALSFGSTQALFDETETCTVELWQLGGKISSATKAGDVLGGAEMLAKLELDFHRTGGSRKEYVELRNPTDKRVDLQGLLVRVPTAAGAIKAEGKHQLEFSSTRVLEPGATLRINVLEGDPSFASARPMFYSDRLDAYHDTVELLFEARVLKSLTKGGDAPEPEELGKIEGIGPKTMELLVTAGVRTYAQLAALSVARLQQILDAAGSNFSLLDPGTWPEQAALAAAGKWAELEALQAELDGGQRSGG